MSKQDIIIIGSGNPDIIDLINDINYNNAEPYKILGFTEIDGHLFNTEKYGYPILGDDSILKDKYSNCSLVNNVFQSTLAHQRVSEMIEKLRDVKHIPNLIHPSSNANFKNIGYGNIIYKSVNFGAQIELGNFNTIYYGTDIGHEVQINNNCLVAASCTIGARGCIQDRVQLSNKVLLNIEIEITSDVFVGLGSVVINSIKKKKKVFGYPAKELKF